MKKLMALAVLCFACVSFGQTQLPVDVQQTIDSVISTLPADVQAQIATAKANLQMSIPADVQAQLDSAKAQVALLQVQLNSKTLTAADAKKIIDDAVAQALAKKEELLAQLPADSKAQVEAALVDMQKRIDEAKALLDANLK